jgi:hypothetical protein
MQMNVGHDFVPYHQTLTAELNGIKDRVRLLVRHWPTDGYFKEAVLRKVLRRHLPESVLIGTGFVVNFFGASGEIDILIVDRDMPTLFKDDELLIVTPESVKAVIEVKTRLEGPAKIREAVVELAQRKAHAERHPQCKDVWAGLFVYEADDDRHVDLLEAAGQSRQQTNSTIDVISYGADTFVKFFAGPESPGRPPPSNAWHTFHSPGVAPANFVASLIERLVPAEKDPGSFALFRPPAGFERRYYLQATPGAAPETFATCSDATHD